MRREKVIILRQAETENPSDIDGLIYIPFEKSILEREADIHKKLDNIFNS